MQQPFSNIVCYCELAESPLFFETLQSCVSTKVTLSHRFKSSPAIPGNLAMPGAAGYMMNAGHFCENYESSGDLNRPRSPEGRNPRRVFAVLFARRKKYQKTFPCRELRGFPNLDSARRNDGFARTKLKPFETFRGSANLDSVRRNGGFALTQFNPLPLCLLETWSPCSRPFAILPVSAVSDAQKLATGNFLHVRAATFSYFL